MAHTIGGLDTVPIGACTSAVTSHRCRRVLLLSHALPGFGNFYGHNFFINVKE
jgi:hypothetical protein